MAAADCRRHGVAEVIASGGGTDNPVLMGPSPSGSPARLRPIDDLGIPSRRQGGLRLRGARLPDRHGLPGNVPSCTGARHPAVLGWITPGRIALALPPARR